MQLLEVTELPQGVFVNTSKYFVVRLQVFRLGIVVLLIGMMGQPTDTTKTNILSMLGRTHNLIYTNYVS